MRVQQSRDYVLCWK